MNQKATQRINIICEVYGTSLERIRKLKHCMNGDLKALKAISFFLRNEEHWSLTDIADLLFRDRSTISYYLKFDSVPKPYDNKVIPSAHGALQTQG